MTMHLDDTQTILARLAAQEREVLTLRQEVTTLRARRLAPPGRRRRAPRFAALIVALLLALVPLALLAAGPFTDLDPASPHNANIAAIQAAGITKGCNPPDFTLYCPKDNVTREEMASFIARAAGLGLNPPVANAAMVGGYASGDLVRLAGVTGTLVSNPVTLNGGYQSLGTVTIDAPGAGFVLVTGTADYEYQSGGAPGSAAFRLRDTAGGGEASPVWYATYVPATVAQAGAGTYVFTVPAAGNRAYTLEARLTSSTVANAYSAVVTALFVPFGPSGDTP